MFLRSRCRLDPYRAWRYIDSAERFSARFCSVRGGLAIGARVQRTIPRITIDFSTIAQKSYRWLYPIGYIRFRSFFLCALYASISAHSAYEGVLFGFLPGVEVAGVEEAEALVIDGFDLPGAGGVQHFVVHAPILPRS